MLNFLSNEIGCEKWHHVKLLMRKNIINEYKMLSKVPSRKIVKLILERGTNTKGGVEV